MGSCKAIHWKLCHKMKSYTITLKLTHKIRATQRCRPTFHFTELVLQMPGNFFRNKRDSDFKRTLIIPFAANKEKTVIASPPMSIKICQ